MDPTDICLHWTVSTIVSDRGPSPRPRVGRALAWNTKARVRLRQSTPGFVLRFIVRRHLDQTLAAILRTLEDVGPVSEGLVASSRVASH